MQIIQEGDTRPPAPLIPLHPFMPYTYVFDRSQYICINQPHTDTQPVSMPQ